MILKLTKIALLLTLGVVAVFLSGCLTEDEVQNLIDSIDATDDQIPEPADFTDIIPTSALAVAITNHAGTVASDINNFKPGINYQDDISTALALFQSDGGIAYDPSADALYTSNSRARFVYKLDLVTNTVSLFAGTGNLSATNIFDSAGSATTVTPRDIDLRPNSLLLIGDYLYISNPGSIVKVPTDSSSSSVAEVQFAGGSGLVRSSSDLDANDDPQAYGPQLPADVAVASIRGLYHYGDYIYAHDGRDGIIRAISLALDGDGKRQVYNYYFNNPDIRYTNLLGSVVHDDGNLYSVFRGSVMSDSHIEIMKLPSLDSLMTYNYVIDRSNSHFSGGVARELSLDEDADVDIAQVLYDDDGDADMAKFGYPGNLVSIHSLLYLSDEDYSSLRVASDDGTVTTIPLVYGDPSPLDTDGDFFLEYMVYVGDNLIYAVADHTVVALELQFE